MWAVALIVTVTGITTVYPGTVLLYTEADCRRFGEIWEETYLEHGGKGTTDHICTELKEPGVDI